LQKSQRFEPLFSKPVAHHPGQVIAPMYALVGVIAWLHCHWERDRWSRRVAAINAGSSPKSRQVCFLCLRKEIVGDSWSGFTVGSETVCACGREKSEAQL
jgi:hypothetical protein